MIKTIKTNQENVKLTIFSSTEDSFLVTSTLVEKDGHALLINANKVSPNTSILLCANNNPTYQEYSFAVYKAITYMYYKQTININI